MKKIDNKKILGIIIPVSIAFFNVLLILFPADVVMAAKEGVSLWFNIVLPSLLPFVIGINILIGIGVVSFLGTLLSPVMRPLFGVPGSGGFALITGMTSGYPIGAKTAAMLREKNELSQTEAQRLIGFTNNSGPSFILGAVGIGLFKSASVGYFIMFCHYTGAILTGVIFRFYKRDKQENIARRGNILKQAYENMMLAKKRDGRSFGEVLGDSVKNAMETVMIIGGFIIFFCVIVRALEIIDVVSLTESVFAPVLTALGINHQLYEGFFIGVVEITNGVNLLAQASFGRTQLVLTVGVISFGGFSIHAQAMSFINKTDIKTGIYLGAKLIHALISMAIAMVVFPLWNFTADVAVTAYMSGDTKLISKFAYSTALFCVSIIGIIAIIIVINLLVMFKGRNKIKPKKRIAR